MRREPAQTRCFVGTKSCDRAKSERAVVPHAREPCRDLRLESYRDNLRSIDFNDSNFENGGSDRLVDAIVVWGEADTLWTGN